jgi:peroxiredoxin/DNA-binding transcriptional MerR regulator
VRITEIARQAGVTTKALRYYEDIGLIAPARLGNGYRDYSDEDARIVAKIRELAAAGIAPSLARPFVDCLRDGHEHGDECPASLAAYRDRISALDDLIRMATQRREELSGRLERAASRGFPESAAPADFTSLPAGLPEPEDDGAADHLPGLAVPELTLPASGGGRIGLRDVAAGPGRSILYLYPLTGRPGVDLPDGWDAIPGARGCSTEACGFRDHFADLRAAGVDSVWGLSSQDTAYQAEVVARLELPFGMLSDERFALADALTLPTFSAPAHPRLYSRLTLVLWAGRVEHAFYPVFPPDRHAEQVLGWLREHPAPVAPVRS